MNKTRFAERLRNGNWEDRVRFMTQRAAPLDDRPLYATLYVMECGGFFKVGITRTDVERRRAELQICNPLPIQIREMHPIPFIFLRKVEAYCHNLLEGSRMHGEWFAAELGQIMDAIRKAEAKMESWMNELEEKQAYWMAKYGAE